MAIIASFTQQPADRLDYDVWYANAPDGSPDWLSAGDVIESATVAVVPAGLTVMDLVFGDRVKLWVSEGVSGVTYKVTVTITTTDGRVKQDELKFKLREV